MNKKPKLRNRFLIIYKLVKKLEKYILNQYNTSLKIFKLLKKYKII